MAAFKWATGLACATALATCVPATAAAAAAPAAPASGVLTYDASADGVYRLLVDGKVWLAGDPRAVLQQHGAESSVAAGTMRLSHFDKATSGTDAFGAYTGSRYEYATAGGAGVTLDVKGYAATGNVVFTTTYPDGLSGCNTTMDGLVSNLPAFRMDPTPVNAVLGVLSFGGTFVNNGNAGPSVGPFAADGFSKGRGSGASALFDADGRALVIGAASEFMAHSFALVNGSLAAGVQGGALSVPAGFSVSTLVSAGGAGVNNAVQAWGKTLRTVYKKSSAARDADRTLRYLGYNTDHGTYYYYNPASKEAGYGATLAAVKAAVDKLSVPIRHVLLDSWWYYKGADDGVTNWTATPEVLPPTGGDDALLSLTQQLGWDVIAHNRYWSSETAYAKENGGEWAFSPREKGRYMVPLEAGFWRWLMKKSRAWGLNVYEQDWLYNEYENTPALTQNATLARTWLLDMGAAAAENDVTIQYCMAYPRHAMQSIEVSAGTQIRASDDYVPGGNRAPPNWNLGGSSILVHAVGLAPFKDSFWTSTRQPGSSCGDTLNPDVWRAAAVATLSTGPVTIGDGAAYVNRSLTMRSCMADGRLLQPDRPATYSELYLQHRAGLGAAALDGHLWTTYSTVGSAGDRYDIVFSTELKAAFDVRPRDLNLDTAAVNNTLPRVWYTQGTQRPSAVSVHAFSADAPMQLAATAENEFGLHYTAPVHANGWALLGELDKWVPVAGARFETVEAAGADLTAVVRGSDGEVVTVWFARGGATAKAVCKVTGAGGRVRASSTGACVPV